MAAIFEYDGNISKDIENALWERLLRVGQAFEDKCKEAVNVPNTGVRVKRKRGRGSYTIYPHPAPKGSPPRKRTGWGQRHIKQVRDRANLSIKVGVTENAFYMAVLEKRGWPWMKYVLDKFRREFQGGALRGP